jgi:SPP1 family predicted phage head-tail adaptor
VSYEIGELSERLGLERKTRTPDGAGGASVAWTEYAEVWALVRPMSGRERAHAAREEANALYLVVIRYRDDVLDADRLAWRGRHLNIRFRKDRGPRPLWLEFEAEMGATS